MLKRFVPLMISLPQIAFCTSDACIVVSGQEVRLTDLAPRGVTVPDTLRDVALFAAPGVGAIRRLSPLERQKLLSRHGLETAITDAVCIQSASQHLNAETITKAL